MHSMTTFAVLTVIAISASTYAEGASRRRGPAAPAVERIYFSGSYSYQGHAGSITCTLRPTGANTFEGHWRAPWQGRTLKYEGSMQFDVSTGKVTGNAKALQFPVEHYRVNGTIEGVAPDLSFTMEYAGVHDGPVELKQIEAPTKQQALIGIIDSIDLKRGRVKLVVETRNNKRVTDADRKKAYQTRNKQETLIGIDPGFAHVCIDPDVPMRAGKYRITPVHLNKGQRIQVFGIDTDEGTVATLVNARPPEVFVGRIESVDAEGNSLKVSVRRKKDRDAEEQTHTILVDEGIYIKTGSRRGTLRDLEAGQDIKVLAVQWEGGGQLTVVAIERSFATYTRRPRPRTRTSTGAAAATASPELAAFANEAMTRTISRIVEAVAAGAKLHVYVEMGRSITKGRVKSADAERVVVDLTGATFPMQWKELAPRRFHDLAMHVVGDGPAEALLDLVSVTVSAGEAETASAAMAKLRTMDGVPSDTMELIGRAALALGK